jgi:hypothetical protein
MYKIEYRFKTDAMTVVIGLAVCDDEATMILAMADARAEFVAYGIPGSLSMVISSKVS